jgi:hypothetical protein
MKYRFSRSNKLYIEFYEECMQAKYENSYDEDDSVYEGEEIK